MARKHVARASSREAMPSPSMKTSPASANGIAEMPATVQSSDCTTSSTNAASGRLELLTSINCLHHLVVDVDGERSAGVVHDPDVEHRRRADVDGSKRARGERRHQAELEANRRGPDVLVLVPGRKRSAWVRTELVDFLPLEI